jgi:hypothetical protein
MTDVQLSWTELVLAMSDDMTQLYSRTLFTPIPTGCLGEGAYSHCPKQIGGLGPFPARIRGDNYLLFSFLP